ncbi:hypothetical protein, partial [Burkholderia sp. Ac-20344]|uniref:hypothetical protein n=1 Tax=Burkholderia sp. Ac-20344 TaxID=2703890 RepID=UPI00197B82A0
MHLAKKRFMTSSPGKWVAISPPDHWEWLEGVQDSVPACQPKKAAVESSVGKPREYVGQKSFRNRRGDESAG